MTREEIYDRLIAIAERAIAWRYETASEREQRESWFDLGAADAPFSPRTMRIRLSTNNDGTRYASVHFSYLATVSRFRGEVHQAETLEAPYGAHGLSTIESELPDYERLLNAAIRELSTAA